MIVPLSAIGSDTDGRSFVWRVDPNTMKIQRMPVTTGALTDSGIEITEGIDPSDHILGAGVDFVVEGQKVRPLDADGD
jgi:multidrug efflux pump subunit AcrA (membrane-fusion protein)